MKGAAAVPGSWGPPLARPVRHAARSRHAAERRFLSCWSVRHDPALPRAARRLTMRVPGRFGTRRPRAPWVAALAPALMAILPRPAAAQPQVPTGFTTEVVQSALDDPVGMAFLPDGRLLVIEIWTGRIRLIVGSRFGAVDPLMTVDSVHTTSEGGLQGIAVDPRWPVKPYVY